MKPEINRPTPPPAEPGTTSELLGTPKSVVGVPTPASLTEALDENRAAWWEYGCWLAEKARGNYDHPVFSFERSDAARQSVISLFSSQQARIEELERSKDQLFDQLDRQADFVVPPAELALLRETALTPEEAKWARTVWLSHHRSQSQECLCKKCRAVRSKLSRIATQEQEGK